MRVLAFKAFLLLYGMVFGQDEWLFLGPGEGSSQPAVISLPLGDETCNLAIDRLPDLLDREGATAALVEGLVTVCNKAKDHMTHCFSLDPSLGTWNELIEPLPLPQPEHFGSQAISLPNGDMLIFSYDTTYIYSIEHKTWTEGPKMPIPRADFCAVPLNATHTFLTGGENEFGWVSDSYIFDASLNFHKVAAPRQLRAAAGCALTSLGLVVVAGGMGPGGHDPDGRALDSVELYDVAADSWIQESIVPSLPVGLGFPASLVARIHGQEGDGGPIWEELLFFGGYIDGSGYTNKIHSFRFGEGMDTWTVEEVEMDETRGGNPSILITDPNILNC